MTTMIIAFVVMVVLLAWVFLDTWYWRRRMRGDWMPDPPEDCPGED